MEESGPSKPSKFRNAWEAVKHGARVMAITGAIGGVIGGGIGDFREEARVRRETAAYGKTTEGARQLQSAVHDSMVFHELAKQNEEAKTLLRKVGMTDVPADQATRDKLAAIEARPEFRGLRGELAAKAAIVTKLSLKRWSGNPMGDEGIDAAIIPVTAWLYRENLAEKSPAIQMAVNAYRAKYVAGTATQEDFRKVEDEIYRQMKYKTDSKALGEAEMEKNRLSWAFQEELDKGVKHQEPFKGAGTGAGVGAGIGLLGLGLAARRRRQWAKIAAGTEARTKAKARK